MNKQELRQIIKEEISKVLNEAMFVDDKGNLVEDKRWAIYVDNIEDWNILANILDKMLLPTPSDRFGSATQVLTALNPPQIQPIPQPPPLPSPPLSPSVTSVQPLTITRSSLILATSVFSISRMINCLRISSLLVFA